MKIRVRLQEAGDVREFVFDRAEISFGCGQFNDVVFGTDCGTTVQGALRTEPELTFEVRRSGLPTRLERDGESVVRVSGSGERTFSVRPGDTLVFGDGPAVEVEIVACNGEDDVGEPEPIEVPAVEELELAREVEELVWRATRRASHDCSPEVLLRAAAALAEAIAEVRPREVMLSVLEDEGRPRDRLYRLAVDEFSSSTGSDGTEGASEDLFAGAYERIRAPLAGLGVDRRETFSDLAAGDAVTRSGPDTSTVFFRLGPDELPGILELHFEGEVPDTRPLGRVGAVLQPLGRLVLRTVAKELERLSLAEENRYFRQRERRDYLYKEIVSESEAMQAVYRQLHEWVDGDEPVLIVGEAGSGKSLLARALHHHSAEDDEDMLISLDCRALDDETLDSELFGCVESELVGAVAPRKGAFELADGGTVFLDEIDLLSPLLQGKLARALKEGEVRRIGDSVGRRVGARLVASTHRDLEALVEEGAFRRELYLLLCDRQLEVPPLRERREDIVPLARVYLETFAERYDRPCKGFSDTVERRLEAHDWRGNARELKAVVESTVLKTGGEKVVGEEHLAL